MGAQCGGNRPMEQGPSPQTPPKDTMRDHGPQNWLRRLDEARAPPQHGRERGAQFQAGHGAGGGEESLEATQGQLDPPGCEQEHPAATWGATAAIQGRGEAGRVETGHPAGRSRRSSKPMQV